VTGCTEWTAGTSELEPGVERGLTTLDIDERGQVTISFSSTLVPEPWLKKAPLGVNPTTDTIGVLLKKSSTISYARFASAIRRNCVEMKATGSDPLGDGRIREIEVVLRASHSPELPIGALLKAPQKMTLDCRDVYYNGSDWDLNRTYPASIRVAESGTLLAFQTDLAVGDFRTDYPLSAHGNVETHKDGTVFRATAAGDVVVVDLERTWVGPKSVDRPADHGHIRCRGAFLP
jgi:hypothetical protein